MENIKDSLGVEDFQSGILQSNSKEQITQTFSNMVESQKYYAKWKQSHAKQCILILYVWCTSKARLNCVIMVGKKSD